jgi:general stress protein YciG
MKKEVDKCMLVCKNCHAEIHDAEHKSIREEAFASHERYLDPKFRSEIGKKGGFAKANRKKK